MSHPPLPDSYEALLLQARALQQEPGQVPQSIAQYEHLIDKLARLSDKILDRRPALRDMRKQAIAEVIPLLRWERRFYDALDKARTLLAIDPEREALWRRDVASIRIEMGEEEAGVAELQALAEEVPADPWSWLTLGHEARLLGRFFESQAALERGLEAARSSADNAEALATAHYERFQVFKETRRWDEAVDAWEQAVALAPEAADNTVPQVYTMLTDAGLYNMARTYVDRDKNPLRAGLQRGLLDQLTGKPVDAMQSWRQVAEMDPAEHEGSAEAWAEAVLRLGAPHRVTERFEELVDAFPSTRLLVLVGIAWAMQGDREAARDYLERAIFFLRRGRPPKQKLDSSDWRLLTSLVSDGQVRAALRPLFAVVEMTWGPGVP